jgi:hypothetical protein
MIALVAYPTIIPMVIVPLTFLFVLLIILIAKSPKAGAWVIGGLLLLAPISCYRFAAIGALLLRKPFRYSSCRSRSCSFCW